MERRRNIHPTLSYHLAQIFFLFFHFHRCVFNWINKVHIYLFPQYSVRILFSWLITWCLESFEQFFFKFFLLIRNVWIVSKVAHTNSIFLAGWDKVLGGVSTKNIYQNIFIYFFYREERILERFSKPTDTVNGFLWPTLEWSDINLVIAVLAIAKYTLHCVCFSSSFFLTFYAKGVPKWRIDVSCKSFLLEYTKIRCLREKVTGKYLKNSKNLT